MKRRAVLASQMMLLLVGAVAAEAERQVGDPYTDRAACYGETLDLALVEIQADGAVETVAQFSLPRPNGWFVAPKSDPGTTLFDLPCLPEPIETSSFSGVFVEPRLGQATDLFPAPEGTRMWSLHVSLSYTEADPEYSDPYERRKAERILESDPEEIDGFLHALWQNVPPYGGGWIYPDDYRSPTGARIVGHCRKGYVGPEYSTLHCELEYKIEPRLRVRYDFESKGLERIPPFIEFDQMVRQQIQEFRSD